MSSQQTPSKVTSDNRFEEAVVIPFSRSSLLPPGILCWALLAAVLITATAGAQETAPQVAPSVRVISDASGDRIQVDGRDFMIHGMNWDYFPIGTNYMYSLWVQPDDIIISALAREMPLLQNMGVNAIRLYSDVPPRWVAYIYETYGIYTLVNHPMARYGFTLNGVWIPSVDYSDPRLREAVKTEILTQFKGFDGVPGVLMWLLGNENNYGLSWSSNEIEALPEGERHAARARHLYSLFEEITVAIKDHDPHRPVAIANGDLQYIDIIAEECKSLDVFGTNVYRGISAGDLYQVVKDKLGIPIMYTEFGSDAFNARDMREDQVMQARYLIGQWREIYEQSSGKGQVGNAIGGFIFQWVDGWWKFGQESRLHLHDTNASWPNGGYTEDFVDGGNNMNEEWWGICAKGPSDARGIYDVYPRAAYYALLKAFQLDPYGPDTDLEKIRTHFALIDPVATALEARSDDARMVTDQLKRARVSAVRMEFETYSTGGKRLSTPPAEEPQNALPSYRGFDHMESFYFDFEAKPSDNVYGGASINVLGHVPLNRIDEIFYENRGRQIVLLTPEGDQAVEGLERVKVYSAGMTWEESWFHLTGFYRMGHTHWSYEGDFFGLYQDAFYGDFIDIYNGEAPIGLELVGRRDLEGFKMAFGPQLWWGANPAIFFKYSRRVLGVDATGIFQEDLAPQPSITSSFAVPLPPTRKATLHLARQEGSFLLELGGIWSGSTKEGEDFQVTEETETGTNVYADTVKASDAWGGKAKITYQKGKWNCYAQAAYQGIVADGHPIAALTFTGYRLKDTGWGNQTNIIAGLAFNAGNFQFAPNFLWQKPLVGPIPSTAPEPARPRNVLDDPFAVRPTRETRGYEFLINYDPTPASWLWAWDNDVREDARLAGSIGFVFRELPTTMDASIGVLANGQTFPFPGAPPPHDLWEAWARFVSKTGGNTRLIGHVYVGNAQARGDDPRLIERFGADARIAWSKLAFAAFVKVNDWGPYDYHRDFNLTFPLQLTGDISYTLGLPRWFGFPQTKMGVRTTWRSLDQYSPRYCPGMSEDPLGVMVCDPTLPGDNGEEWEIRTYLHLAL
jgi:hypothetical protein